MPQHHQQLFTSDVETFRVTSSILDIALAAGECAAAFSEDFEAETIGTVSAREFFSRLKEKFQYRTRTIEASETWTHETWSAEHGSVLDAAEAILHVLTREYRLTITPAAATALERFEAKVVAGRELDDGLKAIRRSA